MYGRTHTPEACEKIRQHTILQFSDPEARVRAASKTISHFVRWGVAPTSAIEGLVGDALRQLGVVAIPQHPIRGPHGKFIACVDFFLPTRSIALEVNGTYWHADPRVYDDLNATQRHNVTRFRMKRTALEAMGIHVVVVWEREVRDDAVRAVREVLA